MAERDKERYFWLKLHRDFFKRHDIAILEGMPGGKQMVLFYLKLMVESIDHEGMLRFSDTLPYSEEMLACVTNTEQDVVHSALCALTELGLVEVLEDRTLYLPGVAKLLDSETFSACRKREMKEASSASRGNFPPGSGNFPPSPGNFAPEKEIEKESELKPEIESDLQKEKELTVPDGTVCRASDARRIMDAWNSLGLQQLVKVTGSSARAGMLRARVKEYGVEAVLAAIGKVSRSAFLRGQNEKRWVITFDWLLKPNNFPKVLEGNYDDRCGDARPNTSNPFLKMMMEENQ